MSLAAYILLYFPRKRVSKPHVTIPLVVAVLVVVEMMFPLRGYIRSFYQPFPKDGGGYFGDELPVEEPLRGWPIPMCHTFSSQFNTAGLNTMNNIYYRMNNAYFKFSSIEGYDDATFYVKDENIEDMPWLKNFGNRLFFVSSLISAEDRDTAQRLTKRICESGQNLEYAVVEGLPSASFSKDISFVSSKELDHISTIEEMAKPSACVYKTHTFLEEDFHLVGTDSNNKHVKLYVAKLPDSFP